MEISKIKIFVEGKDDQALIRDCLKTWYDISVANDQIIKTDGFTNLLRNDNELKEILIGNKREGGINLVIFDADEKGYDENNKYKNDDYAGFESKSAYLNSLINSDILFQPFLFPNHQDNGCLEDLIKNISTHQEFYPCWNDMEQCLSKHGKFSLPNKKAMIYSYIDSLFQNSNKQNEAMKSFQKNKDFTNSFWDLSHEYIQPLKQFLDPYFK